MTGENRGRTPGLPGRPLTDPGVRFSRTGLFNDARFALVLDFRRLTIVAVRWGVHRLAR